MEVLYILFPLALLMAGIAVVAYIWVARAGQFDDMETPAMRVLHDDQDPADGKSKTP